MTSLILFAGNPLHGQEWPDMHTCELISSVPPSSPLEYPSQCPFENLTLDEVRQFPITYIDCNVYYIRYGGDTGIKGDPPVPAGNMLDIQTGDPDWNNVLNGNLFMYNLLQKANEELQNLVANPISNAAGYPNVLGDTRIRFRLKDNPDDSDGIYYVNSFPSAPNNPNVYNIYMVNQTNTTAGAWTGGPNDCSLNGIYRNRYLDGKTTKYYQNFWNYSGPLIHERMHYLGSTNQAVCHSFDIANKCAYIDIHVSNECNNGTAGATGCGGGNGGCDFGATNLSNNIMGYSGKPPYISISPCQLKDIWHNIANNFRQPQFSICDVLNTPLIIPSGTHVIWEKLKMLNQDVIVETGAELTIKCEVRMGSNRTIIVKRGARLNVDNSKITSLCSVNWNGIFVEGNSSLTQCDINSFPSPVQCGVVRALSGSTIENANVGISTNRYPEQWDAAYWGGLIYAVNVNFYNNKKGIEFMKFTKPNKSYIKNSRFREVNKQTNSTGITIWECGAIKIENNEFGPFDLNGIYGIDFGADIVNGNKFMGIPDAIELLATKPITNNALKVIGSPSANRFTNNNRDIYIGGSDISKKSIVSQNIFEMLTGTGQFGIYSEGISTISVDNNDISSKDIGFNSLNGSLEQDIFCNEFNSTPTGISFVGHNPKSVFANNGFVNTSLSALNSATSSIPGWLREIQSQKANFNEEAANCFELSTTSYDIFAAANSTVNFRYLLEEDAPVCYIPINNLSDGGTNNYNIMNGIDNLQTCSGPGGPGIFDGLIISDGYPILYQKTDSLKQVYTQNISLTNLKNFLAADQKRSTKLSQLIIAANTSGEYTPMLAAFAVDQSIETQRMNYAERLHRLDYTGATTVLNQLPYAEYDDVAFKDIQSIILAQSQLDDSTKLSTSQKNSLLYYTTQQCPSCIYAKGYLALKEGMRFSKPNPPMPILPRETLMKDAEGVTMLKAYPNPANQLVTVEIFGKGMGELTLMTMTGQTVFKSQVKMEDGSFIMNVANISNGVYIINLITEGKSSMAKLTIQK